MKEEQNNINKDIDITSEIAAGNYSNLVIISHSPSEVVLDFAQMLPGIQHSVVRTRVIMTPAHSKRLLQALTDNLHKYEEQYGTITEPTLQGNNKEDDVVAFDMVPQGDA